ncbi:MAG TPA: M23 family metallopeptidase [Chloroflexia bacterium]|nr:M23 family metallopeptidase [Chloroflexia bacterium]
MPAASTPPTGSLTPAEVGDSQANSDQVYIGETGHYIRQPFLNFWRDNGAYRVFGYPLSEVFEQNGLQVQLFDQALLEYHPDQVNKVQLGFLGKQLADAQSQTFPDAVKNAFKALPPGSVTGTGEHYFNETGHFLKGAFNEFWVKNELLKFLGLPISEEINQANGLKVQYFERGRLEYNSITQKIDYSNSGDLLVAARGWKQPGRFALELQNTSDDSYTGFKIDQGRTFVVKLKSDGQILPAKVKATFNNIGLKFAQVNQDFVVFVPVDPSLPPGSYHLAITFLDEDGLSRQINREVQVITHDYGTQNVELPSSESYLSDHTADDHDDARLATQYQLFTTLKMWSGKWQWPLQDDWVQTTNFAQRRILNGQLDTLYYHGGLDLAPASGVEGDPVYAAAPGKVVFVDQLEARGLSVVLDHGLGVTSYYFHLSGAKVLVGQQLKEGDLLGNVGSSGRATGPHLHWEVRVQGIITDPRSFIRNDLG